MSKRISALDLTAGQVEEIENDFGPIDEWSDVKSKAGLLVRLEADPETVRERILAREPPGWGGLPELLNASRALAASMPVELSGVDLVLSTEGEQPATVAERIAAALPRG